MAQEYNGRFFAKRHLTKKLENHSLILGDLTNQNSFWKCKVTWLFCDCHAVIIRLMSDISKMDSEFFLISLFPSYFWHYLAKSELMVVQQLNKWRNGSLMRMMKMNFKCIEFSPLLKNGWTYFQWSWISNGSPKTWARSILVVARLVRRCESFLTPTAAWEKFRLIQNPKNYPLKNSLDLMI